MSKLPEIVFLGWDQALLDLLVNHFIESVLREGELDLSDTLIVLPGQNAARRLQELILFEASKQGFIYKPGRLVTPGQLPELIIESSAECSSSAPKATELQSQYLLAEALMKSDINILKSLGLEWCSDNLSRAYSEAAVLKRAISELLAAGEPFTALVERVEELAAFDDAQRWQALASIYESYTENLSTLGMQDRDLARLSALEQSSMSFHQKIYLCGCTDLAAVTLKILQKTDAEVTAFIFAPVCCESGFDTWGQLNVDYWSEQRAELKEDQMIFAMQDSDQFVLAERWIEEAKRENISSDLLTLGLGSIELEENLPSTLGDSRLRSAAGRSVRHHRVYSFLKALQRYVADRSADSFLKFIVHPDVDNFIVRKLGRGGDDPFFTSVKKVLNKRLVGKISPLEALTGDTNLSELAEIHEIIDAELKSLPLRQKASVGSLVSILRQILTSIFSNPFEIAEGVDRHFFVRGLEECAAVLEQIQSLEGLVQQSISFDEFISLALQEFEKVRIEEAKTGGEVEVIGWLELLFDDRPSLFLLGMNEGSVPETITSDLLLPNSLRQSLGLQDNTRRYARDNYALHALHASRNLFVSCSKYSRENKLKLPSRLVLSQDQSTLTEQYKQFFDSPFKSSVGNDLESGRKTLIELPLPLEGQRLRQVSVSGLTDYLSCPYRFYLKHIGKVRDETRDAHEMDASLFGNLIHNVLREFGRSPLKDSTDLEKLNRFLQAELERQLKQSFPLTTVPSVALQVESLRARLSAFAGQQVEWAKQGWQIKEVEFDMPAISVINAESEELSIVGRIDRIDYNQTTNEWALLDYKTGDAVTDALKSHYRGGRWYSVQLPAYRMALRRAFPDRVYNIGYVILPQSTDDTKFNVPEWKDDYLQAGEEKISELAESILAGKFWPPNEDYRGFDPYPFVGGKVCL